MNIRLRTHLTSLQRHIKHEFANIKHFEHEFKNRFTLESSKSISRDISSPPPLTLLASQNLSNHQISDQKGRNMDELTNSQ